MKRGVAEAGQRTRKEGETQQRAEKPAGGLSRGEIPSLREDTGARDLGHFSARGT